MDAEVVDRATRVPEHRWATFHGRPETAPKSPNQRSHNPTRTTANQPCFTTKTPRHEGEQKRQVTFCFPAVFVPWCLGGKSSDRGSEPGKESSPAVGAGETPENSVARASCPRHGTSWNRRGGRDARPTGSTSRRHREGRRFQRPFASSCFSVVFSRGSAAQPPMRHIGTPSFGRSQTRMTTAARITPPQTSSSFMSRCSDPSDIRNNGNHTSRPP